MARRTSMAEACDVQDIKNGELGAWGKTIHEAFGIEKQPSSAAGSYARRIHGAAARECAFTRPRDGQEIESDIPWQHPPQDVVAGMPFRPATFVSDAGDRLR